MSLSFLKLHTKLYNTCTISLIQRIQNSLSWLQNAVLYSSVMLALLKESSPMRVNMKRSKRASQPTPQPSHHALSDPTVRTKLETVDKNGRYTITRGVRNVKLHSLYIAICDKTQIKVSLKLFSYRITWSPSP